MAVVTAEGIPWLSAAGLRRLPMFSLLLLSCTIVHLNFERVWWFTEDQDIFSKYAPVDGDSDGGATAAAASASAALHVAKQVYFTKATWMMLLVWLLAVGQSIPAAMSWSFVVYAMELIVMFPVRTYTLLNALLAFGLAVEQVVEDSRRRRQQQQQQHTTRPR
jgi:hypothetical protein